MKGFVVRPLNAKLAGISEDPPPEQSRSRRANRGPADQASRICGASGAHGTPLLATFSPSSLRNPAWTRKETARPLGAHRPSCR